jgi:hypothetical protein
VGCPADLLRRRPDLRSAEAKVQAQWYSMVQDPPDGEPPCPDRLAGPAGHRAEGPHQRRRGLVTALGLNIDWPIWEAGKRQALVAEQKAAWDLSRASYESTLLGAVQDVEDALVATRDSVDRCQALQAATEAAQRVVDTQRQRHSRPDRHRHAAGQPAHAAEPADQPGHGAHRPGPGAGAALQVARRRLVAGRHRRGHAGTAPSGNPLSALFRNEP